MVSRAVAAVMRAERRQIYGFTAASPHGERAVHGFFELTRLPYPRAPGHSRSLSAYPGPGSAALAMKLHKALVAAAALFASANAASVIGPRRTYGFKFVRYAPGRPATHPCAARAVRKPTTFPVVPCLRPPATATRAPSSRMASAR